MLVLIGIILVLAALVIFLYNKKQTADALLKNNDVKQELNQLDGEMAKNQGLIDAEKAELERKKLEELTKDGLVDFLNKHRK